MGIILLLLLLFQNYDNISGENFDPSKSIAYHLGEPGSHRITVIVQLDIPSSVASSFTMNVLANHTVSCMIYDPAYLSKSRLTDMPFLSISKSEMEILLEKCRMNVSKLNLKLLQMFVATKQYGAIIPGTKWCGPGSIAQNDDDLGFFKQLDACCRTHDYCPDQIGPKEIVHGLKNEGRYYRLACYCDEMFKKCLKNIEGAIERVAAQGVGLMYFDCYAATCFKRDYPKMCCSRFRDIFTEKCVEYRLDTSKNKTYQWWDSPGFSLGDISYIVDAACELAPPMETFARDANDDSKKIPECPDNIFSPIL
ncbi:phospholipase A2 hemilipin-like [Brevipalpus obovatus]|uniref:phospholipase A2 hemilipin-like n=1 Tax=Brevipalpus obovatus TaxID=246614 RepID=UPI003D9E2C70